MPGGSRRGRRFFHASTTPGLGQSLLLQGGNSVRSFLTIAVAGATVMALSESPAASSVADDMKKHGVTRKRGKMLRHPPRMPVTGIAAVPLQQSGSQLPKTTSSRGRFVQRGKAQFWVPNEQLPERAPTTPPEYRASEGRFVQEGKAQVWVSNEQLAQRERDRIRSSAGDRDTTHKPSRGRFVRQGKAQVWVPNEN
jgi:hypothetical protein